MPVYFFQAGGDGGPIKIGHAQTPAVLACRLAAVRTGNHLDVQAIGVRLDLNGLAAEYAMHKKLAASRIRGEWFSPTSEVMHELALSWAVVAPPAGRRMGQDKFATNPARILIKNSGQTYGAITKKLRASSEDVRKICQGADPDSRYYRTTAKKLCLWSNGELTMDALREWSRDYKMRQRACGAISIHTKWEDITSPRVERRAA